MLFSYSFAVNEIAGFAAAGIGMTGQQRNHVFTRLDQDCVYIVRRYDFYVGDPVSQRIPQVCDDDFIPRLQLVDVSELVIPAVPAMAGDHGVCVSPADGDACL